MEKNNFLTSLQKRAQEQQILRNVPLANVFLFVSKLLGENPWKILIPLAIFFTFFLQIILGKIFDEFILWIFGAI